MIDYRQFFQNSLDLLATVRPDGTIEFVNPQCCQTLGYSPASLWSQPFASLVHPVDQDRAEELIGPLAAGRLTTTEAEIRLRRSDGTFCPIHWTFTRPGSDTVIYATGRDVTEAKRIRQERTRLARIASSTHNAVVITDTRGRIEWVNEGFTRLTEYTLDEVIGRTPGSVLQGPDTDPATVARIREAVRERRSINVEIVNYSKSGRKYWLGLQIEPLFDEVGELTHFMAIELDIDERKRQEEELLMAAERQAVILDSAGFAIIAIDESGLISLFNRAASKMLGYSAEEVVGKVTPAIFHLHEEIVVRAAELTLELGTPIQPTMEVFTAKIVRGLSDIREWTYVRKDGSRLPGLLSASVLHDGKGGIVGFLGVAADMSLQHEAEAQMKRAQEAAENATRLKSEFLANMSHEIRTPMNGILGFSNLLRDTPLQKDQREYVDTIHHCADSLLALINDVLDYSKIEAGMLSLERISCDLQKIVGEVCDILSLRARPDVELIVDWTEHPLAQFLCDPLRLRQVLLNLIGNALKFTEKGHVLVTGRVIGDTFFRVEISDTGIGIEPEKQAALFEKFVQADASTTRRFGGTGLGLAISRQLVQAMGGEIGCTSQAGSGSTFWFTLPIPPRSVAPSATPAVSGSAPRILIVDDVAINRHLIETYCDRWGFPHASASSGEAGLQLLRAGRFDAAVVDYFMPEMDGLTMARHVNADPAIPRTPLLLLSSSRGGMDEQCRFQEAGFSVVLPKPLVRPDLLRQALLQLATNPSLPPVLDEIAAPQAAPQIQEPLSLDVLLAEDNAVNQRLAAHFLHKLGCRVDVANDGLEALAKVRGKRYDVVLMDCQMPRMDGYEAAAAIRLLYRSLPIVAVTANVLSADRDRCRAAGMTGYIAKPLTLVDLLRVLQPIASRGLVAVVA